MKSQGNSDRSFLIGMLLVIVSALIAFSSVAAENPARMIAPKDTPCPAIHGPRIVGTTPGRPFLFKIPATGEGPLAYSAQGLPEGLKLDPETGIISGTLETEGKYVVKLRVTGQGGQASRNLNIVGGKHKLALTPPMGWNSWNVWGLSIDDARVRAAADAMVESGLAVHGFQYINIDDGWENGRGADGVILPNEKFPDMNALADYVHSKGLKLGIYSSPGPKTCGLYEGSFSHEAQDAETYAEWGIDYLKYDYCSYFTKVRSIRPSRIFKKPYIEMREILDQVDRDIVYSICQYGMHDVEKWGAEVGGNLWRTTGDIRDNWKSMSRIGFGQNGLEKYSGPGLWNDPDMLVVGKVGWGPTLHESGLTHEEHVTHITLWCMLASPLLIGCDMSDMDRFTIDVLTNDEVLEVNQDPLGRQASRKAQAGQTEVWSRPLWDGTLAVALFNRSDQARDVTANWLDLGISGPQPVRDLWLHKDLGVSDESFTASVPSHGAVMLKIGKPEKEDFSILE
jgi:alpha-galactosidase